MFKDKISLNLQGGRGGDGIISWRKEKYIPKGGPAGGDGGKGGDIILEVDTNLISFEKFKKKVIKAENGEHGKTKKQTGKNGKNLILKVPLGTVIKDLKTKKNLFDLTKKNEKYLLCKGGIGGRGNAYFKSSTNRAPYKFTRGIEGEKKEVELELKLIADIGLVGFPNAGKSTLFSSLTNSKTKIGDYPFTTLIPNIAYIKNSLFKISIADIPGIIKDAHKNKGLGLSFLRHIERTSILLFIIDISSIDKKNPLKDIKILKEEIKKYSPKILKKPFLVILNKSDKKEFKDNIKIFKNSYFDINNLFEISALKKIGLKKLILTITNMMHFN
ncbi:MAG: GTPase CgtA [Chlamydiae bacterium SM23_39]|nr:MAG: GTPase CgtA [Chlamydiae bacterium SM23_39]